MRGSWLSLRNGVYRGNVRELARRTFLEFLQKQTTVQLHAWPGARLHAVTCSDIEIACVRRACDRQVDSLSQRVRSWLEAEEAAPPVDILYLGRTASLSRLNILYPAALRDRFGGLWDPCMGLVVISEDKSSLECVLAHQLTHAYIDMLSDGYPFPLVLEEGFAELAGRAANGGMCGKEDQCPMFDHDLSAHRLDERQFVGARRLLELYDAFYCPDSCEAHARLVAYGLWLMAFVGNRGRELDQRLAPRILATIRQRDLRAPANIYAWLLEVLSMTEQELEQRFERFCTTACM